MFAKINSAKENIKNDPSLVHESAVTFKASSGLKCPWYFHYLITSENSKRSFVLLTTSCSTRQPACHHLYRLHPTLDFHPNATSS